MRAEIVHMRLQDLGAEIDLRRVTTLQGRAARSAPVEAQSALPPTSRFPQPVEVTLQPASGPPGAQVEVRVYSLGAISIRLRWSVEADSTARLWSSPEDVAFDGLAAEEYCRRLVVQVRRDLEGALRDPYDIEVPEERYTVYCLHAAPADVGRILRDEAVAIAQLTSDARGVDLVPSRLAAAQKHTLQYTPGDAVVIGWDHAVILDEPGQYEDILDVMELANLELLEFRTYDAHLDQRLETSFAAIDRLWAPGGLFRSARSALRDISRLRVEFARLTDNLHDTGKIFGDWYTAQLHQRLHERFHLASWARAVASKMATLEDMFHLAQEETNHRRTLVLEVMVVLLFVLDLALLVRL